MAFQVSTTHVDEQDKPLWKQWKLFHATLAQFTYTGAQGMSNRHSYCLCARSGVTNSLGLKARC
jgi:hypothetical protein